MEREPSSFCLFGFFLLLFFPESVVFSVTLFGKPFAYIYTFDVFQNLTDFCIGNVCPRQSVNRIATAALRKDGPIGVIAVVFAVDV